MFKEGRKIVLISAAVAAIGFGASAMAIAGAATKTPSTTAKTVPHKHHGHQAGSSATEPASGADTDNVESGPQTGPDNGNVESGPQTGPDNGNQAGDPEAGDSTEQPGSETNDGQEQGSEVQNNDGPSGHADEPGNPNANHEAGGQTEE